MDYRDLLDRLDLRVLAAPEKRISGAKPVMVKCPWHDDRHSSLGIWPDHLHCFGCGVHKGILDYLAEQENLDIERDFRGTIEVLAAKYGVASSAAPVPRSRQEAPRKAPFLPLNASLAKQYHDQLGEKRRWYRDRGLRDGIIDGQLLGHDGRAFTIPVWHSSGELLTIRYRRDDSLGGSGPKYWGIEGRNETLLYNQGALAGSRLVVVTEGELDCLRLWQEGIPVVSSTNGAGGMVSIWEKVSSRFNCAVRVIIAFDQDEGGQKPARELLKMINGHSPRSVSSTRAMILKWDIRMGKDITELAQGKGIAYVKALLEEASHV
jgi:DNA primase